MLDDKAVESAADKFSPQRRESRSSLCRPLGIVESLELGEKIFQGPVVHNLILAPALPLKQSALLRSFRESVPEVSTLQRNRQQRVNLPAIKYDSLFCESRAVRHIEQVQSTFARQHTMGSKSVYQKDRRLAVRAAHFFQLHVPMV